MKYIKFNGKKLLLTDEEKKELITTDISQEFTILYVNTAKQPAEEKHILIKSISSLEMLIKIVLDFDKKNILNLDLILDFIEEEKNETKENKS